MIIEARDDELEEAELVLSEKGRNIMDVIGGFKGYVDEMVEAFELNKESALAIEEKDSAIRGLQNENLILGKKVQQMELEREHLRMNMVEAKEVAAKQKEVEKLGKELERYQYMMLEQSDMFNKYKDMYEGDKSNSEELKSEMMNKITELERENAQMKEDIGTLSEITGQMEEQNKELGELKAKYEKKIKQFKHDNEYLQEKIRRIEEELEASVRGGQERMLESRFMSQQSLIEAYERQLAEKSKEIKMLGSRCQKKNGSFEQTESDSYKSSKVHGNEGEIVELRKRVKDLENMYNFEIKNMKKINSSLFDGANKENHNTTNREENKAILEKFMHVSRV
jgi:chromosome segregation ATPase